MNNANVSFVRLKVFNWGLAESSVLDEAKALARRKVVPLDHSLYQLLIRGITPNPHASQLGKAALYSLALERMLRLCSEDCNQPKVCELRQALRYVPEIRKYYSVLIQGEAWTLRFKSKRARWTRQDWARSGWHLVVDVGGRFRLFSFSGAECSTILELFSYLNGDQKLADILAHFQARRTTVLRFLRFCSSLGLLVKSRRKFGSTAKRSCVELVSHSCVRLEDRGASVLVDPVFFIPRPENRPEKNFVVMSQVASQFSRLTAVFFTHNHWDHLHVSTAARIPRHIPIYVPRLTSSGPYNPSLADFFKSLGFTNVSEVRPWRPIQLGAVRVTPAPFFGEWFGPNSSFDAFTYLIELAGKKMFGTVDSHRDDRGNMLPVLKKLHSKAGRLDYFFFSASAISHENPAFCGMPYSYSNSFARKFSAKMTYLPDFATAKIWLRLLKPRVAVPYADFQFTRENSRQLLPQTGATRLCRLRPGDRLKL